MTPCRIIGITGGISTGKSTVSRFIAEKYPLIDADIIAREVVNRGEKGYNMVVDAFGQEILDEDLNIDRAKLSTLIFNDSSKRERLNSILHPVILTSMAERLESCAGEKVVFLDIPLLFESKEALKSFGIVFDEIWLVYCDRESQLRRLMLRDGISSEEAKKKIGAQFNLERKKELSDLVIDNSGSKEELFSQLRGLLEAL